MKTFVILIGVVLTGVWVLGLLFDSLAAQVGSLPVR